LDVLAWLARGIYVCIHEIPEPTEEMSRLYGGPCSAATCQLSIGCSFRFPDKIWGIILPFLELICPFFQADSFSFFKDYFFIFGWYSLILEIIFLFQITHLLSLPLLEINLKLLKIIPLFLEIFHQVVVVCICMAFLESDDSNI
jgi:hypothetical protein